MERRVVEIHDRHHERPCGERIDHHRDEVEHECLGRDRPQRAPLRRLLELPAERAEQSRANVRGGGAGHRAEQLGRALRIVIELGEEVAREIAVLEQHVDLRGGDSPHLLLDRRVGREDADHDREELPDGATKDRFGEALLVAEVVVEEGVIDAGLARDLGHARSRRAAAKEHGVRRVENAGLGIRIERSLGDRLGRRFGHIVLQSS